MIKTTFTLGIFIIICVAKESIPLGTRSFQFMYSVDIESTDGKKLELWIPVPVSNEVQTISNLQFNMNGLEYSILNEKMHNNKYLYINHESGTKKQTSLTMIFNVIRKEHKNVNYNNVNPKKYLEAYNTVPIGGVFNKIISENDLSINDIRGIYNYVLEGMHYGKPKSIDNKYYQEPWLSPDDKYGMKKVGRDDVVELYKISNEKGGNYTFGNGNAIYACDIGVGNCTDYHSYFISLDRTMGIPTRFHMGFSIPLDESGKVRGYHCWADYIIKGKGWFPVDISEADKDPNKKDYYFGTIDNNRIDMIIGRDFILEGYDQGPINLFIYPIMEINDKTSSTFSNFFSYKEL